MWRRYGNKKRYISTEINKPYESVVEKWIKEISTDIFINTVGYQVSNFRKFPITSTVTGAFSNFNFGTQELTKKLFLLLLLLFAKLRIKYCIL